MKLGVYDQKFFDTYTAGSLRSARVIVPLVRELAPVGSVVDFGCGRGAWLLAFKEDGVDDVLGLDGPYVDRSQLLIGADEFRGADLGRPVDLGRGFDLAVCLEVAEHLPARSSRALVRSLTAAAPLVLFSAAIPGQGGTCHVNEQWPEYWDRRFGPEGYRRIDVIRPQVCQDRRVDWWYRQNAFLYAREPVFGAVRARAESLSLTVDPDMEVIHGTHLGVRYKSFRGLVGEALAAGVRAVKSRVLRG
jgi:SAM-dependent methyltransferase